MTYFIVRLDTKEIFDESAEEPTKTKILEHKSFYNANIMVIEGTVVMNSEELEGLQDPTSMASGTVQVRAIKKIALAKVVGHDKSCKDEPTTPEILATGNIPFYRVAEGQPGAGQFCRKDKTAVDGS